MEPGEFVSTIENGYPRYGNEKNYMKVLANELGSAGMPNHAIMDTSRNAVQGLRENWIMWCNVNGAGFGRRPTNDTKEPLADAFVWVAHGGESDGTSDPSSPNYDPYCGSISTNSKFRLVNGIAADRAW